MLKTSSRIVGIGMLVKRIELRHVALPLTKTFRTSFGVIDQRPAIVISMSNPGGLVGYGESSPLYAPISEPETLSQGMRFLERVLPKLVGKELISPEALRKRLGYQRDFPVSAIGVEGAFLDLLAKEQGISVQQWLGGSRWNPRPN